MKKLGYQETKTRYEIVKETQSSPISEMVRTIISQDPFDGNPFYIFAHKRTIGFDEKIQMIANNLVRSPEEIPDLKLVWQPRLTKPEPQENSMLFKVYPGSDKVEIRWIIPEKEKFHLYEKGKFFENQIVAESVHDFVHNKKQLTKPEPDDLSDERIREIYAGIKTRAEREKADKIGKKVLGENASRPTEESIL